MQPSNLQLIILSICIILNAFQVILTFFSQKIRKKISAKLFSGLFLGNIILISIFMNLLFLNSQEYVNILVEIIAIILLQVYIFYYLKKIRENGANLVLSLYTICIFGLLRVNGLYFFYQRVNEEFLKNVSLGSAITSELFLIFFVILVFFINARIIFSKIKINSFFSLICSTTFIFGLVPFIDLSLYDKGLNPLYLMRIWNFMGLHVGFITVGIIFQYILLGILVFGISINIWHRESRSNKNQHVSSISKFYIVVKLAVVILLLYCFINFIAFSQPFVIEITYMFNFEGFSLANPFIHPFWVLTTVYLLVLLIPIFLGYLSLEIIKKRRELWNRPSIFTQIPFFNLIVPIFFSFIVFYYELVPIVHIVYIDRIFILFVGFFILISFLILLILYLFNFQKKPWMGVKFSLKLLTLFIPFFIGYLLAGQILSVTDLFFGIISCSALQIYVIYLQKNLINSKYSSKIQLNRFIAFFSAIIVCCFAALLSLTCLFLVIINLSLLFIAIGWFNTKKWNRRFYIIVAANILLLGGTSSTFLSSEFALGIPNNLVFYGALILLISGVIFNILIKKS